MYHNNNRVRSTKNKGPWSILYSTQVDTRKSDLKLERKLKDFKSRKRILLWTSTHMGPDSSVSPEFYQIFDLEQISRVLESK